MKHQCEDCKKVFLHPSKATEMHPVYINGKIRQDTVMESTVCPYCFSLNLIEVVDPLVSEQKTVGVLVIDLVPGDNLALNKALTDGYEITGRFSKQYILDKKDPNKTVTVK